MAARSTSITANALSAEAHWMHRRSSSSQGPRQGAQLQDSDECNDEPEGLYVDIQDALLYRGAMLGYVRGIAVQLSNGYESEES